MYFYTLSTVQPQERHHNNFVDWVFVALTVEPKSVKRKQKQNRHQNQNQTQAQVQKQKQNPWPFV